jgi:ABC-type transport system involved in multi-copper enzyme maturation permease subunit
MREFRAAFFTEYLKVIKSRVFWFSLLLFAFVSCMMGLIMFVQKYPELASKLGMIGTKANLFSFGGVSWTGYFGLLMQAVAAVGYIGFGFVTSWVFGREYSDKTLKDLLALPVSRSMIVLAKFSVSAIWCLILAGVFLLSALLMGSAIGLSGWSDELIRSIGIRYSVTALLSLVLCWPAAFFACLGRGILLPIGFVILTLLVANFTGLVGLGPYFPWAIAGLYATGTVGEGMLLTTTSYIILLSTGFAGLLGTLAWWRLADHT